MVSKKKNKKYMHGDIVTYSDGVVKTINKPSRYYYYFDSDYCNPAYKQKINKIERYYKLFGNLYIKKTIYKR